MRIPPRNLARGFAPKALLASIGLAVSLLGCGEDGGGPGGGEGGSGASSGPSTGTIGAGAGGNGGPGCGLKEAAFCDTFDAPAEVRGRGGDLDSVRWSVSRHNAQLPTGNGVAIAAGPSLVPTCRDGVGPEVFPDEDSLICEPTESIDSPHLLVAVGMQNYGQNSYRIRQPFDFTDRTGKIVFDADGWVESSLYGWIGVAILQDPTPMPNFSIGEPGTTNIEGGAAPRRALEVHFNSGCAAEPTVGVGLVDQIIDYQDTVSSPEVPTCVPAAGGKLNHFEIELSQKRVKVSATPFSEDGKTFGDAVVLFDGEIDLPFSRGYVVLTAYNHATLKYSGKGLCNPVNGDADCASLGGSYGCEEDGVCRSGGKGICTTDEDCAEYGFGYGCDDRGSCHLPGLIKRFDNVGFDGPIVHDFREYEIPDSLVPGMDAWNVHGPVMSVGYTVADDATGPSDTLVFPDVDTKGVKSARIAVASWYLTDGETSEYVLRYRLNKKAWHDRPFTSQEAALLKNTHSQGSLAQMIEDVPVEDLVDGDNTIEFVTKNVSQSYPPAVAAIDLILTTR